MGDEARIELVVNGRPAVVAAGRSDTLLDLLRDRLGLTGVKNGCAQGDCGCCTSGSSLTDRPSTSLRFTSRASRPPGSSPFLGWWISGVLTPM